MPDLTQHQAEALVAYEKLMSEHPELFANREQRPIVKDIQALKTFAAEHDVTLGVAASTPYALFIVDLVESRTPNDYVVRHPYLRVVSCAQMSGAVNVVILATIENPSLGAIGDIVLVEQARHATGSVEMELPRGFGERGLSGEKNALKELREESGYVGERARLLGSAHPDSGLSDTRVSFFHVPVSGRRSPEAETGESIQRVKLASLKDIWNAVKAGEIRDGFTIQALALYAGLKDAG